MLIYRQVRYSADSRNMTHFNVNYGKYTGFVTWIFVNFRVTTIDTVWILTVINLCYDIYIYIIYLYPNYACSIQSLFNCHIYVAYIPCSRHSRSKPECGTDVCMCCPLKGRVAKNVTCYINLNYVWWISTTF